MWWYTPVIPAPERYRQKNHEFQASLHYIVKTCLKRAKQQNQKITKTTT
jgi:hypothetical protein